ncbi:MAG: Asp-tRNA(Asn)/Glu-tRNA(Gln) amidotransferase GatCAB subunit B, partial [Bdellovibrionales bacterium]|nr:Asp-tRNA(Asn)/Glu-tRNA(Gln) amidotransferase GatCAB subunit B [Bdellovibrionales bacterium]
MHAQLSTDSKLFSAESTKFGAAINENVSPVSLGLPGALPVLNKKAVLLAIKTGHALHCDIQEVSIFSRKNYFYPDLAKGYQISQFDQPICKNGYVDFYVDDQVRRVHLQRAHLEEDAGKSIHYGEYTLVDYNRAGIPLLEIVTYPEIRTPTEAAEFMKAVRDILRFV